jgi:hypothetical protein
MRHHSKGELWVVPLMGTTPIEYSQTLA